MISMSKINTIESWGGGFTQNIGQLVNLKPNISFFQNPPVIPQLGMNNPDFVLKQDAIKFLNYFHTLKLKQLKIYRALTSFG